MPVSLIAIAIVSLLAIPSNHSTKERHQLPPLPPDTSVAHGTPDIEEAAREVESALDPALSYPAQILIPAIGVNSYVVNVGVNAAGEMDVPDGATNNVGWYQYGTVPGKNGSAVMDAHVYAAFKKLKYAQADDRIYVVNAKGETHEFKIISSKVYTVAQVPMQEIFTDASGSFLNLITCEGRYSVTSGTYSHRRVVYAELVEK